MEPFIDYYRILGLTPEADASQIKQAFRRLARRYHPDVAGHGSLARFQQISEAYQVLRDPQRRQQFDHQRRAHHPPQRPSSPRHHSPRPHPSPKDPRVVVKQPYRWERDGQQQVIERSIREIKRILKSQLYTQAVTQAEALARQYPRSEEATHILALCYHRLGSTLLIEGESQQARVYLNKALETEPHNRELVFEVRRDLARLSGT